MNNDSFVIGDTVDEIRGIRERLNRLEDELAESKDINVEFRNTFDNILSVVRSESIKQVNSLKIDLDKSLSKRIENSTSYFEEEARSIFENSVFINRVREDLLSRTTALINDGVESKFKTFDLNKHLKFVVEGFIKDNLKDVVDKTISSLVASINRKLRRDYETTKDLCYSIDSEVRHVLMKLPVSACAEDMVKKKINDILLKQDNLIESKLKQITGGDV